MVIKAILYINLLIIITACKSTNAPIKAEDFSKFYFHFITDSTFQHSRIIFPIPKKLNGEYIPSDVPQLENVDTLWRVNDWNFISKKRIDQYNLKTSLQINTENSDVFLYIPNSDVSFLLKFKLMNNKWILIYYRG